MGYMGNIVLGIAYILDAVYFMCVLIIIGSVVISWVNADPYNPIVRVLRNLTDPVFRYIRRYLPFVIIGGLDLSPIVAILSLMFVKYAIIENLFLFAGTALTK